MVENFSITTLKENKSLDEDKSETKKTYYPKIYEDIRNNGYQVYAENEIKPEKLDCTSNSGGKRIDGIFIKDDLVLVGEIKAPKECNTIYSTACIDVEEDENKNNWSGELKKYAEELNKKSELNLKEKGHLIHLKKIEMIAMQIKKKGCFEIKLEKNRYKKIDIKNKKVKIAYTVPKSEISVVKSTLNKMNIKPEEKSTKYGTTFIIDLTN